MSGSSISPNAFGFIIAALAFLLLIAIGIYIGLDPARPVASVAYVSVMHDGAWTVERVSIPSLVRSQVDVPPIEGMILAAVPSTDATSLAFVAVSRAGYSLSVGEGQTIKVVQSSAMPLRDITWARGSNRLAYAALASSTDSRSPDSWSLFEIAGANDAIQIGHGVRPIPTIDGQLVALTARGVELFTSRGEAPQLLIASAVAADASTPITMTSDGSRIAWINPADRSLQIFERGEYGTYGPILLKMRYAPQSIAFSPDGKVLLSAFYDGEKTRIELFDTGTGEAQTLGEVEGQIIVNAWEYADN